MRGQLFAPVGGVWTVEALGHSRFHIDRLVPYCLCLARDLVGVGGLTAPAEKLAEVGAAIWRLLLFLQIKLYQTVPNYFVFEQYLLTVTQCFLLSLCHIFIIVDRTASLDLTYGGQVIGQSFLVAFHLFGIVLTEYAVWLVGHLAT